MRNKKPLAKIISIRIPVELYYLILALKPDGFSFSDAVRFALQEKFRYTDLDKTTKQLEAEFLHERYSSFNNEKTILYDIEVEDEMEE